MTGIGTIRESSMSIRNCFIVTSDVIEYAFDSNETKRFSPLPYSTEHYNPDGNLWILCNSHMRKATLLRLIISCKSEPYFVSCERQLSFDDETGKASQQVLFKAKGFYL